MGSAFLRPRSKQGHAREPRTILLHRRLPFMAHGLPRQSLTHRLWPRMVSTLGCSPPPRSTAPNGSPRASRHLHMPLLSRTSKSLLFLASGLSLLNPLEAYLGTLLLPDFRLYSPHRLIFAAVDGILSLSHCPFYVASTLLLMCMGIHPAPA